MAGLIFQSKIIYRALRFPVMTVVLVLLIELVYAGILYLLPPLSIPAAVIINLLVLLIALVSFNYMFVIPGHREILQAYNLGKDILDNSSQAVVITDSDSNIEYVNTSHCDITGYAKEELIGENPRVMKSDRHDKEFYQNMWNILLEEGIWEGEIWDRRKNGEVYPKWLTIKSIRDDRGKPIRYIGMFNDITYIKQHEEYLKRLANIDELTRLPNRNSLRERLVSAVNYADHHDNLLALMLLDLDGFKNVNDSFGHLAGDSVLIDASERLKGCIRVSDVVARIGGDEFAIILSGLSDPAEAGTVSQKVIDTFVAPFKYKGLDIYVGISIGITIYPMDGMEIDRLMENADLAMYDAKKNREINFQYYDEEMTDSAFRRLSVEANLRAAIKGSEFILYYQPQVDVATRKVIGAEALIRRQERDWLVPPMNFIPIAEESGLIVPIGEWTLRRACMQLKEWQEEGFELIRVAVNVSSLQFQDRLFVGFVRDVIAKSNINPEYLELELTERIIMKDADSALKVMKQLKELGACLSIDDFGTGYSSLSYLGRLPIDKLKIDQSFVNNITTDKSSTSIIKSTIELAHNLGMKVIAEGVEKEEQLLFLKENGCDEIQGYFFSRPLPTDVFKKRILLGGRKL
jgi:diguanylate cyclase (GGDEF)-like protein/PAS domain S-box-containing protein